MHFHKKIGILAKTLCHKIRKTDQLFLQSREWRVYNKAWSMRGCMPHTQNINQITDYGKRNHHAGREAGH